MMSLTVERQTSEALRTQHGASPFGNTYQFAARRFDDATGLYYYRNRYYEPVSERFINRDALGYHDSLNVYAYVRNNSVNRVDPLGLQEKVLIPKFVLDKDDKLSRSYLELDKADFEKTIKKAFDELLKDCMKQCLTWKNNEKRKDFVLRIKNTAARKEFEIDGRKKPITDPKTNESLETINTKYVNDVVTVQTPA